MSFTLPLDDPPVTTQEDHQCWSAAYESWSMACSRIIRGAHPMRESEIEAALARYPGALDEHGAATLAGIGLLGREGQVDFTSVSGPNLTTEVLRDRLTSSGYIYLVFWGQGRHAFFSHAVVIANAEGSHVRVMDPGAGRGLRTQNIDYYRHATVMLIGTHVLAHDS